MESASSDLATETGVSLELARLRAGSLSDICYELAFDVPSDTSSPVTGTVAVGFTLSRAAEVILDFADAETRLRSTRINGVDANPRVAPEHVVLSSSSLRAGANVAEFDVIVDDTVLNRQDGFLYSLFVPARARRAFPCFDQPDLKARFTLTLRVPSPWVGVSNAPLVSDEAASGRRELRFEETALLPTYLFAFAAGTLTVERTKRDGRDLRIWHLGHDLLLVERNCDELFDLHARALAWLEAYTGIPYPFRKFDIVLVPSFQFSGMEHPGAILYNANRLLLEESATAQDRLTRASLIAHETAHIWFGDLVTMRWFDDVWLKEVFANFVADKIVGQAFASPNRDLRFFLAHYPQAYSVDRTEGANAIRQPLGNLADAGQLYGPIIYLKAPVVFRQLELEIGPDRFREGARRFLRSHQFGTATWDDLLTCLSDSGNRAALASWSAGWIEEPGRPTVSVTPVWRDEGLGGIAVHTIDPAGRGRVWPQRLSIALGYDDRVEHLDVHVNQEKVEVDVAAARPRYLLGAGRGLGYGYFPLDAASREWLLARSADIPDPLTRAAAWTSLWDDLLAGVIVPTDWVIAVLRALATESEELHLERLVSALQRVFWLFLSTTERDRFAGRVEACLHDRLMRAGSNQERSLWFAALRQLTTSADGCAWLASVWRRQQVVQGIVLGDGDEAALALELAIRNPSDAASILSEQYTRIHDPERRARLAFLTPALSPEESVREHAFARLARREHRAREPWVLAALHYLNHPLRQAHARRFIRPGLELLPEIQRTGDIFLPSRWTEALLGGHASPPAAAIVREFLDDNPALAPRLRNVVLVAADLLFRTARPPY